MGKKFKSWCESCHKKTIHELCEIEGQEISLCLKCQGALSDSKKMLDIVGYVDPRELYSLRADRALEEERIRIGRPF